MQQVHPDVPEPDDVPDRTPRSHAHYRNRVRKPCVMCNGPFLVATPCAKNYQTCSVECSSALRSRSQQARFGRTPRAADHKPAHPNAKRRAPNAAEAQCRPAILLVGRAGADVLCVRCGGLRGRWMRSELPPPELCWRCLMRRNSGFDPGMPLG